MFSVLFYSILKNFALPLVAILVLQPTIGLKNAVLAIAITLTFVNLIVLLFQGLKLLGNTVLLKGKAVMYLILRMVIEVVAIFSFWIYYSLV